MIALREYTVSADDKWLNIDLQANPALSGVYIKTIRVSCTGDFTPSDTSATFFDGIIADSINEYTGEKIVFDSDLKEAWIRIDVADVACAQECAGKPFFLQVTAEDPNGSATTCAYKSIIETVAFNKYPLYKAIACSAKRFEDCDPPIEFVDFLMRLKALEASIKVYDVQSIKDYYDWLIKHSNLGFLCEHKTHHPHTPPIFKSGCGCRH